MNTVFLDTVGLLAVWDTSDQWHGAAADAFFRLRESGAGLITTSFVLLECGNAAARRPYRPAVDRLRQRMEEAGWLVVPTEEEGREAWDAYSRDAVGGPGIVDHVSFVVMRRLCVTDAFTDDRHFHSAGFTTLF